MTSLVSFFIDMGPTREVVFIYRTASVLAQGHNIRCNESPDRDISAFSFLDTVHIHRGHGMDFI